MYRVTTPTHTFKLPFDTSNCSVILLDYKQDRTRLTKKYENGVTPSGMTLDDEYVIQVLTQEETKGFKKGTASIQIRVLTNNGSAYASKWFTVGVNDVINEEVL